MDQATMGSTKDRRPSTNLEPEESGFKTWNHLAGCIASHVCSVGLLHCVGDRGIDVGIDVLRLFVDPVLDIEVVGDAGGAVERGQARPLLEHLLALGDVDQMGALE